MQRQNASNADPLFAAQRIGGNHARYDLFNIFMQIVNEKLINRFLNYVQCLE